METFRHAVTVHRVGLAAAFAGFGAAVVNVEGRIGWVFGFAALALVGAVVAMVGYLLASPQEQERLWRRRRW